MTYIPNTSFFSPGEFVSEELFNALGGNPVRIYWLFDDRLLRTAVRLRIRYGPMTVNTWQWGGRLQQRGFRTPDTGTGAAFSDHRTGRAIDCHFRDITAEEVRADILARPWHSDFEFITSLEMTLNGEPINWLHFSTRNWDKAKRGIQQLKL